MLKKLITPIVLLQLFTINLSTKADEIKAYEIKAYSLEECFALALENNLSIKMEKLNYKSKKLDLQKEYDNFGINFDLQPGLQNNIRPTSNSFISGASVLTEFEQTYNLSLSKKFISNGELSLSFQNGILNTNSNRVDINPVINSNLSLNLQQPLLRNFSNGFKSIAVAKSQNILADHQIKSQAIDIIFQVQEAYLNILLNKERLNVLEKSLELSQKLLDIDLEKEKEGFSSKLDVLNTKANILSKNDNLLQAKKALSNSEDNLKNILNISNDLSEWDYSIDLTYLPELNEITPKLKTSYQEALKNRPDYQNILIEKKIIDLQIEIAEQNKLPEVNLSGRAGLSGLDQNYLSSLSNMMSLNTYFWNIGLNISLPITGNLNETNYKQILLNKKKQEYVMKTYQNTLIKDLRSTIRDLEINYKRLMSNKSTRELLTEQVNAETEKFNLGISTNLRVLQVQEDLEQAGLNEVNAKIDYFKSINNFEKIKGISLEKNNILWSEKKGI